MARGDVVVMRLGDIATGAPRLRGFVTRVPDTDESDVLWENGEFSSAVPDSVLLKCFDPVDVDQSIRDIIGQYVQINNWPTAQGTGDADHPGPPKSPAAAGVVRRAYAIDFLDDPSETGPIVAFVEIEVLDGKAVIQVRTGSDDAPGPITVQGRRQVQRM